jgi:tyrosyl-tRNA synthetase
MEKYLEQADSIVSIKESEIFYNSSWFLNEGVPKIIELAAVPSIQQVLRRADFKKRLKSGKDVSLLEMLYPALQGYDSVKVKADVEIGGSDQIFNLLMGRKIQRHFGMDEQDVLTVPLLVGIDGKKKMSKSFGNYIGLTENPSEMFGKIMSVPDKLVGEYFLLVTELEEEEIKKLKKELSPMDFKARLGFEVVKLYHGEEAAELARQGFEKLFSKKEAPADLPGLKVKSDATAMEVVLASGAAKSKSEARRLIEQGSFEIDGAVKKDPNETLSLRGGEVIKIGKKRFFRAKI